MSPSGVQDPAGVAAADSIGEDDRATATDVGERHRLTPTNHQWLAIIGAVSALLVAFVSAAHTSRWLTFRGDFVPLWLPAGIAFATLSFHSRRSWPALLGIIGVAALVSNTLILNRDWGSVIGFSFANLASASVGAALLQSMQPGRLRLRDPREMLIFTLTGCIVSPVVSACLGGLTVQATIGTSFWAVFPTWFSGNAVGVLIAAPMTLVVFEAVHRRRHGRRFGIKPTSIWAYSINVVLLCLICWFVFRYVPFSISFVVFPCMLALALQFEVIGAATGTFAVSMILLACTSAGFGEFAQRENARHSVLLCQAFLFTSGSSFLTLGVTLSQRRRLRELLQRAQLRMQRLHDETELILDTIPSMVLYTDERNHCIRVNEAAAAWPGVSKSQLQNRSSHATDRQWDDLFGDDGADPMESGVPKLGYEGTVTLPNGEHRWVIADRIPLRSPTLTSQRRVAVVADITQRREAELALAASNEDLERFASIAAHDLKEPLRAVRGYCQFLAEDHSDQINGEGRRYIESAIAGAKRMETLLDDLLAYSRMHHSGLDKTDVDLNDVLKIAISNLRGGIEASGATVSIGELPTVPGFKPTLVQVFQNLIANSIKFGTPGKAPCIDVQATLQSDLALVRFKDNGIGLRVADQGRIFDEFQRLNHPKDYAGSGLGLAICRRVMQRHGGSVRVDSRPGEGACFTLTFPLSQSQTDTSTSSAS
ncbi:MAG: MASE1 domain-containing protein [Planctomycetota bacterium]